MSQPGTTGEPHQDSKSTATHNAWDTLITQHPDGNILQTSQWGQLKAGFGWDWETVTSDGKNGALVLYRPLPLQLGTVAYIPRGPLADWQNRQSLADLFKTIEQRARKHHAWAIWVEPPLLDTPELSTQLTDLGFKNGTHTVQPPRTILVDIAPQEEEILAQMKQKTRYNIRLAGRKGVTVRLGNIDDVDTFYELMTETGERDAFGVHSRAYYRRVMEIFMPTGNVALLLAEVETEPVAGIITFALGKMAWYFYGASSNRHRNLMPTYLLQWEAIRWAKEKGCTTYDLWGIPDVNEEILEETFQQRDDGLWGVYRFKRGFGGRVVRYTGLWEKALHPLYPLASKIQQLRS